MGETFAFFRKISFYPKRASFRWSKQAPSEQTLSFAPETIGFPAFPFRLCFHLEPDLRHFPDSVFALSFAPLSLTEEKNPRPGHHGLRAARSRGLPLTAFVGDNAWDHSAAPTEKNSQSW